MRTNRAGLAALAVAALATAGTATGVALAAPAATTHTLRLTAHTLKSHQAGNTFLMAEKDTRNGNFAGYDAVECTLNSTTHKGSCAGTFTLLAGTLSVRVTVDEQGKGSGTVTGGTRHYNGATGTVTVNSGSNNTTNIVITYQT